MSRELTAEFGRGFSYATVNRAIQFSELFPDPEIVSTLSTQLSWSHFMELLPIKEPLARAAGRIAPEDMRSSKATLVEKLQLAEGTYLKRAAVLLFHEDPEKFITGAFVKIGYFRSESDLAYHDTLHGDLFSLAARTIDLLQTKYLKAAITYRGIQRIERYPVPDAALRESILNALVHRDYAVPAPVQIRVYANRLSIWNPCSLPEGWTLKKLLGPHSSAPHNPAIAHVFFRSGEIETWGRGIQRILTACREAETPKPRFTREPTGLWTEFPFAPSYLQEIHSTEPGSPPVTEQVSEQVAGQVAGQVSDELRRILAILRKEMSRQEIQAALALRGRENFEARYLKPALEAVPLFTLHSSLATSHSQLHHAVAAKREGGLITP